MIPLLITAFGLAIRLIRLDSLPGEMWGDMFVHYHLIEQLNEGKWITGFMFGDGPIYSYIAFLVARVFGLSFYSLKLTSVLINCGFIWLSYSFGLVLSGSKRVAFLTSFLAAASFWSISFARTGWPNNLVPLFVEGVILCLWHRRYALAGIVAGSGLYTQAAAWGLGFFWSLPMEDSLGNRIVCARIITVESLFFRKRNVYRRKTYRTAGGAIEGGGESWD